MWCRSYYDTIVSPQTSPLTLFHFLFLNVYPSPVSRRLYSSSLCCNHINRGLHTIAFVLPRFAFSLTISNISTSAGSVFCTHMGFLPLIYPPYAYKTMLCLPASHSSPCCASCRPHTSSSTSLTTAPTTMLKTVGYTGSPWVTSLPVLDGKPYHLSAFSTTTWYAQTHCSSILSFVLRPYSLSISMHRYRSSESYAIRMSKNNCTIGLWNIPTRCCTSFTSKEAVPVPQPYMKPCRAS